MLNRSIEDNITYYMVVGGILGVLSEIQYAYFNTFNETAFTISSIALAVALLIRLLVVNNIKHTTANVGRVLDLKKRYNERSPLTRSDMYKLYFKCATISRARGFGFKDEIRKPFMHDSELHIRGNRYTKPYHGDEIRYIIVNNSIGFNFELDTDDIILNMDDPALRVNSYSDITKELVDTVIDNMKVILADKKNIDIKDVLRRDITEEMGWNESKLFDQAFYGDFSLINK